MITYDEAMTRAQEAAFEAQDTARAFDNIDDKHPQFDSFTHHYSTRATMYAQVAQAMTTRSLEAMEAGL